MKVTNPAGLPPVAATASTQGIETPAKTAPQQAASRHAQDGLQSDALKPVQAALADMPEIDAARVADIKAALADGRIQFDAGKLAALIRRHHGGGT